LVTYSFYVAILAEIFLVCAAFNPNILILKIGAVVCFCGYALHHNAVVGTHFEMLAVWSILATLLPNLSVRVNMFRVFAAYSVAGPGITKLFVSGRSWCYSNNIKLMNDEFAPSKFLRSIIQNSPDTILYTSGLFGLVFEAFIPLLFLVVVDAVHKRMLFWALVLFHSGCLILVGMFFVHHIPVYAAALFLDTPILILDWYVLIIVILMVTISLTSFEEWPVSNMGLFPYDAFQAAEFKNKFGSNLRLVGVSSDRNILSCSFKDSMAVDLIAWSLHATVPLNSSQWEGDGRFGCPTYWAKQWLDLYQIDLEKNPQKACDMAAKRIGSRLILFETVTMCPITVFHVVEVSDEKIVKIISTSKW